jgi:hypothetical protein
MKSCTNNFGGTKLSGEVSLGVRAEKRLNTTGLGDQITLRYGVCACGHLVSIEATLSIV